PGFAAVALDQTRGGKLLDERGKVVRIDREIEKVISGQALPGLELSKPVRQTLHAPTKVRSMIEEVVCQWLPAIIRRFFMSERGQASSDVGPEGLVILVAPGHADQGEIGGEMTTSPQAVQRGEDFARCQITGDAEDDEGEGLGTTRGRDKGRSRGLRIAG